MSPRRSKSSVPTLPEGKRVSGYLWCRVCQRSWEFKGTNSPGSWPMHRCGHDVRSFNDFLTEDPNQAAALPEWKV